MTGAPERNFEVYNGRDRLGTMIARAGCVDAFDPAGVHLGTFPNVKAAVAAINHSVPCSRVSHHGERGSGGG